MSGWVSPSFSKNRRKCSQKETGETDQNEKPKSVKMKPKLNRLWSEIFEPTKEDDLAVNPKKLNYIRTWLQSAFNGELGRSPVAVFSGPSGSGKTTSLKVLCKSMGFTIREWISVSCTMPSSSNVFRQAFSTREPRDYENSSQVKQFEEFLFRASRYSTVFDPTDAKSSILLIEDIPNVYIHDPSFLQKTLHNYVEYGLSPIVFICSSGSHDFNLERILFKPQLVKDLNITIFSFNPISKTILLKALWRVINLAKKENRTVLNEYTQSSVQYVAESSNNDLRFAVNQLQFIFCSGKGPLQSRPVRKPTFQKKIEKREKKKKKSESETDEVMLRDPCADVFRCLGRVLYCKIENEVDEKTKIVKETLSHDPFQIINSMYSVPNLFQGLMNENYLTVFNDIKKIAEAGEFLCLSDNLMVHHRVSESGINYSLNISVLGLMNASCDNILRKFNPFRGSKSKDSIISCKEKLQKCRLLFPEKMYEPRTLLSEVFPFMVKLDISNLAEDKKRFVKAVADITSVSAKSSGILDEETYASATSSLDDVKVGVGMQKKSHLQSKIILKKVVPIPTGENVDDEEIIIEEDDSN